ncbi:MAG: SRPBCC domain-containing protein [Cyclobacteriaceae bacterium]|nr:SRPBCC domain-containing protein [Cyclobacteriaceae bacterium]
MSNFSINTSVTINAPVSEVWDAVTNPVQIKKYMFGTDTKSTWKVGEPIVFSGEWDGKPYEDKGIILAIEKEKLLKYNYWSNLSGTEDTPENYADITYEMEFKNGKTVFAVTQTGLKTEEAKAQSESNWGMLLGAVKEMLEKKD